MRSFILGAAVAAAGLFSSALADVDPIVIKGSKFFYKTNGTQFYIRGVAYQQDYEGGGTAASTGTATSYVDPLANATTCERDIPYLLQLRTNTIRVYAVDPTQNHDACMTALANAGIYVIADLSDPTESIDRDDPAWTDTLYSRYTSVIDAFAGYTNTMGFFAGNEVSNSYNTTAASAFVKAAVRDMKAYISAQNYRTIGVGYAADDDATIRSDESRYMNCGDSADSIDFWGLNIYEWCGSGVTFSSSGYEARTEFFSNYSVPVFFAEYGCITPSPRTFDDTPVLYGSDMDQVWSGGIVYMYFQEDNDYGLVTVSGNTVSTLSDFSRLSSQIATVSPSGVQMSAYTPSNSVQSCPTTYSDWQAASSPLPPTPNQELCTCMYNSLSCVVSSSVSNSSYGTLFGVVCGLDSSACGGITANSTLGDYGAYSMCNSTEQLAYVLDRYYSDNGASTAACDFSGSATIKSATAITGSCSSLYSEAGGASGTGTVTAAVSGTGSTSTHSSSSSGAAAPRHMHSSPVSATWYISGFVTFAFLSGAGMILL